MTHKAPDAAPAHPAPTRTLRSNADYRWTPSKAVAFLDTVAAGAKVAAAARAVGMTRQSAYRLRDRSALVARLWPAALAAGAAMRAKRKATHARGPGPGKATHPPAQSDAWRRQGDTPQRQGDASRRQGDTPRGPW